MKKAILFLLFWFALLLPLQAISGYYYAVGGAAAGGNDFSSDSDCMALWRFESGALTTDSKGSNTLTDHSTVEENTTDYKEGSCSADFEDAVPEYFSITDADLDADYPLKSGDSNKKISVTGWFRVEQLDDGHQVIYSKYNTTGKRSFAVFVAATTDVVTLYIGYNNGDDFDSYEHASAVSNNVWYHCGVTWQDSDKSYRIRIWDDNAGAILGVDKTGTGSNNISVKDEDVTIGSRGGGTKYWDGELDEIVVFKDILSTAEIDKIRAGTYP